MNDEAEPPCMDKALPVIASFTPYLKQFPNDNVDSLLQFLNANRELAVWLFVMF